MGGRPHETDRDPRRAASAPHRSALRHLRGGTRVHRRAAAPDPGHLDSKRAGALRLPGRHPDELGNSHGDRGRGSRGPGVAHRDPRRLQRAEARGSHRAREPHEQATGPGRDSYLAKQAEILARDCHLIEIDLHRHGRHVMSLPDWRAERLPPYDYLACVCRWPRRNRFEVYSWRLRDRLPQIMIPLVDPDPDVPLDLQAAFEHVYAVGRYAKRVRYNEPCDPPLAAQDQGWATEQITAFRAAGGA
ncbi:MAG: DUF4058 family protein [Planctomycetes bacterium]|nr:DUF4058 family protein [Planctomycetota bacterium]